MISLLKNTYMLNFADDNKYNKRAYVKLGHDCRFALFWCDRVYDPT